MGLIINGIVLTDGAFFYPLIVWDAKSSIPEGTIQLTNIRKYALVTRMPLYCSPFNFTPNLIKISSFAVKLLITLKKSCYTVNIFTI